MGTDSNLKPHLERALRDLLQKRPVAGWISLVIDPLLADDFVQLSPIQALMQAEKLERQVWPLTLGDVPKSQRPYLLSTQTHAVAERLLPPSLQWAWAERSGQGPAGAALRLVCGWLVHDTPPKRMAEVLAQASQIRKPTGQPWVLRYWDPRTTPHVARAWPEWQQRFGHLLTQWNYWQADGYWQTWAQAAEGPLQAEAPGPSLRANAQCWQALQRIGPINQLLALRPQQPPTQSQQEPSVEILDAWLAQAQALGYIDPGDWVAYGAACMQCHPDFYATPRLQQSLRGESPKPGALLHTLQGLSEADWSIILKQAQAQAQTQAQPPNGAAPSTPRDTPRGHA